MEKFDSMTRSYFHSSHLVLIVYSTDSKNSLNQAVTYITQAMEHAPGACLVLIRNKTDLSDKEQQVSEQEARKNINYNDFKFRFKTSAKTGEGIREMIKKLGNYLYKHNKRVNKKSTVGDGVVEVGASQTSRRLKCCLRH
jgi:GTPase SAR1 family protein